MKRFYNRIMCFIFGHKWVKPSKDLPFARAFFEKVCSRCPDVVPWPSKSGDTVRIKRYMEGKK